MRNDMRDFKVGDIVYVPYCITKNRLHRILAINKNDISLINLTHSDEAEVGYSFKISNTGSRPLIPATKLECYLRGIDASTLKP
jgi:hypothetical protein